ncbi:MAG: hypothetical protein DCF21_15440 [Leptolyngbya sp.]|nr:MAG: hypothetical protein DCF21_15440 [Leptolyngbya sp.]
MRFSLRRLEVGTCSNLVSISSCEWRSF